MHTFFINTSGKSINNYTSILEIQHETRKLVSLDCPIKEWSGEDGYKKCVRQLGEMIDNYKNINNTFNLVLYVDLISFKEYNSVPKDNHRERYALLKVLRTFIKHYINHTIVKALNDCGRIPQEVLIVFEENELPEDADEKTEDGKRLICSFAREFLGIPDDEKFDKFIFGLLAEKPELTVAEFLNKSAEVFLPETVKGVLATYDDEIDSFLSEVKTYDSAAEPLAKLFERMLKSDDDKFSSVSITSFVTNRSASDTNKRERARRDLRLCLFLVECVEDYNKDGLEKVFPELDWDEVAVHLYKKKLEFKALHKAARDVEGRYHKIDMAPVLKQLNHEKFNLDEFGNKGVVLDTKTVEAKPEDKEKIKEEGEGSVVTPSAKMVVEISSHDSKNLLAPDFVHFDYDGEKICDYVLESHPTEEDYYTAAKEVRALHIDYLKRLQANIQRILSRYAGRSSENESAMLKKRRVSVAHDFVDDVGVTDNYSNEKEETDLLKNVKSKAQTAYQTVQTEYLRLVAGRSVAVTDIEEQTNWFVTRVAQISDSLKKIKTVAFGILIAMLMLYIPFFVIQWEGIFKNLITMLTAVASVAIPIVLLYGIVFPIVYAKQRCAYKKAWKTYMEKSREVIKENAEAAREYDNLLAFYAPALRWVYEYKLDVDFYESCCNMAAAKIAHHKKKLFDRIETLDNIIEDLECDEEIAKANAKVLLGDKTDNSSVEYVYSFCGCHGNREFYSIIDATFLKEIKKGENR